MNFDDRIRQKPMRCTMHRYGGFFVGCFHQAKDLARPFVVPILAVIDPIRVLDFAITLVRVCDRSCGQAFNVICVSIKSAIVVFSCLSVSSLCRPDALVLP